MKYDDGKSYDQKAQGPYYDLWFEMIEHYLDIYLPEKGQILDAGGGTGEFSIRAANLRTGVSIVNFDISQQMLDQANMKISEQNLQSRILNKQGNLHDLPFTDSSFAYVMCFGDALSFCSDPEKAFSELVRVTRNNGRIHVSVNSFWGNFHSMFSQGLKQRISYADMKAYEETRILHVDGKSTGCRSFTMNELSHLAQKHNLNVQRKFAAPVFPAPEEWLADPEKATEIKKLQYKHCEEENILEFGNHLNVIYEKI